MAKEERTLSELAEDVNCHIIEVLSDTDMEEMASIMAHINKAMGDYFDKAREDGVFTISTSTLFAGMLGAISTVGYVLDRCASADKKES